MAKPGQLSEHFHADEFRCRRCRRSVVDPVLLWALQSLRTELGRPLPIVSGFRCREHNAAVGGASGSFHLSGQAVDVPVGLITVGLAERHGFSGIGHDRWHRVRHLDVRPGPRARWLY